MSLLAVKVNTGSLGYLDNLLWAVRYWEYQKVLSPCGPEPYRIYLVGAEPPECIKYKDESKSNQWINYIIVGCSLGISTPYYAWDLVADCPWPDGISIEEVAPGCALVNLCITYTGEYLSFSSGHAAPYDFFDHEYLCVGDDTHMCPEWITGTMERKSYGWRKEDYPDCGEPYTYVGVGHVQVDCFGVATFSRYICGLSASFFKYIGTGNAISLDVDGIPVGTSVIPIYYKFQWEAPVYQGVITVETSRC